MKSIEKKDSENYDSLSSVFHQSCHFLPSSQRVNHWIKVLVQRVKQAIELLKKFLEFLELTHCSSEKELQKYQFCHFRYFRTAAVHGEVWKKPPRFCTQSQPITGLQQRRLKGHFQVQMFHYWRLDIILEELSTKTFAISDSKF